MRRHVTEPITPARDPASIDRRGLVGVGELATPRWTRAPRVDDDEDLGDLTLRNDNMDYEHEDPDSPWTIEARDGETESVDHVGRPFSNDFCHADYNSDVRPATTFPLP
jgi:dual specificity tyrosine-phosphorylation-regulated kinase 2/3/4